MKWQILIEKTILYFYNMSLFSLNNKSSLKSQSEIDAVFKKGQKISSELISLHYNASNKPQLKTAFSVGKKKFKLSVKRNKIKRLMREAFRLNACEYIGKDNSYNVAFVFTGPDLPNYKEVENSMKDLLISFKKNVLS